LQMGPMGFVMIWKFAIAGKRPSKTLYAAADWI
jgi:hypothetical protein